MSDAIDVLSRIDMIRSIVLAFIVLMTFESFDMDRFRDEDRLKSEKNDSLVLDLVSITEESFLKFEQNFNSGFEYDSSIVVQGGDSFKLEIAEGIEYFDCPRNYRDCHYYRGFLKAINSYVITQCGDICVTYLIDKTTGSITHTMQCFDNGSEVPVISESGDKALVFSYSVFDVESCIVLYDVHEGIPRIREREGKSFKHLGFRIAEVVWIDERTIALKTFQKTERKEIGSSGNYKDVQVGVKYWKGAWVL